MEKINWKDAQNAFISWSEMKITPERLGDLLLESGLQRSEIFDLVTPQTVFGNNVGKLSRPRFFANVESGDLFMVGWIQNVPTLWSWVEITEQAWNIWSLSGRL